MFRRRRGASEQPPDVDAEQPVEETLEAQAEPGSERKPGRGLSDAAGGSGPWDVTEVEAQDASDVERIDLGGLLVPGVDGMELRVDMDEQAGRVVAVTVVLGESALQLQPFAAPRREAIWAEVRAEIAAGITRSGGTADEVDGTFGRELRAAVPAELPTGRKALQPARFLGYDGPRWFLRGVLTGRAASDPGAAAALEQVFRDVAVRRGSAPMAPREPIELQLPQAPPTGRLERGRPGPEAEGRPAQDAEDRPDLQPFERGPEITEIR